LQKTLKLEAVMENATCLTPKLNALYTKLGITASKITSCMSSDESLYTAETTNAQAKGASEVQH